MNGVVQFYGSLIRSYRQILISSVIAILGILTSVAIAVPLDKVSYNIVMTSDGFPIIFPKENVYGFDENLSETELINNAEYCGSGSGCSPDAIAKGALYYVVHIVDGKQVIAYYNADGKLVATQQSGGNTPSNPTTPSQLPDPVIASFDNSSSNSVGYLEGDFSVSDSGAATYNVPIALPPGTAGVQPNLSLAYSSQSGEGIAGLGWSISGLSAVTRCPKNIAQDGEISGLKFDNTDNFCLDGQRLVRVSGTQGGNRAKYKTEIDNYSEITSYDTNNDNSPEYFEVETKAGEIHVFGKTDDSRVERVFSSSYTPTTEQKNAYKWSINRTKDRLGNYIDYVYHKDYVFSEIENEELGREHYLAQIKYTGNTNTGLEPYLFVDFSYKKKNLPVSGYFAGSKIYRSKLLQTVKVSHMTEGLIRQYKLDYYGEEHELNNISKQDKLKSIEECGVTACLPSTYFTWDGGYASNNEFSDLLEKKAKTNYIPTDGDLAESSLGLKSFYKKGFAPNLDWGNFNSKDTRKLMGDVNGDGLTDIVFVKFPSRSYRRTLVGLSIPALPGQKQTSSFDFDKFDISKAHDATTSTTNPSYLYPSYLADVNGDGLADLVHLNWSDITVNLSNGSGFDATEIWLINQFTAGANSKWDENKHPRFVQDINGDGKADLVGIKDQHLYVSISKGASFSSSIEDWSSNWSGYNRSAYILDYSRHENSVQLSDVSGDGLPDLIVNSRFGTKLALNQWGSESFLITKDFVPNPYSWFNYSAFDLVHPKLDTGWLPQFSNKDTPKLLGDINGDGYPDMVGFFDKTYVAYGTGSGFLPYKDVDLLDFTLSNGSWDGDKHPRFLVDVNADGKSDIVGFGGLGIKVAISNGDSFDPVTEWMSDFGWNNSGWNSNDHLRTLADFNGDGLADIIGINSSGIHIAENQVESLRIARIITGGFVPEGGNDMNISGLHRSIEVRYEKLTTQDSYAVYKKSTSPDGINIQPSMFVVSSHHSSNGDIANNETSLAGMKYTYEGLKVDRKGRGSLGFAKRTVEDLISHIRTTKTYKQLFPSTGIPDTEVTELNIGDETYVKLSESKTLSSFSDGINGKYYSLFDFKKTETDYNFNEVTNTSNPYKRIVTEKSSEGRQCGNVPWINITTSNLTTGDIHSKKTVNAFPPTGNCFDQSRLVNSTVTSTVGSETSARKSAFTYTGDGQIRTETVEPGNDLSTKTTYGYDAYGNVDSKSIRGATKSDGTGLQTRRTTMHYDAKYNFRFATSITNSKNQTETKTYDKRFGTVSSVTGPNQLTSTTHYNQFGQKFLTVAPNNTWIHTSYDWCNVDMGEENNVARYCTTTESSEGGFTKSYYDQIDRVVRKETKGLNGATAETTYSDKIYNLNNGQLVSETLPYFKNQTSQKVRYTYDKLERSSTITQPDGSVSRVNYDGFTTTVTDAKNNNKIETINALGKPSVVTDSLGNTIQYDYYADGNLRATTNSASTSGAQVVADTPTSTTTFSYDILGNKTSMTDPDMGTWSYGYNAFGELVTQTDANSQTSTLTYDVLGRLITRIEDEGTTRWTYDTAAEKGIGKLHKVTSSASGYSKTLSYDALGQVARLDEKMPAGISTSGTKTYTVKTAYDKYGRVDQLEYPTVNLLVAPIKVKHEYSATGALKSIKDATTGKPYWTVNSIDARGNIKKQTLGNGVITNKAFDQLGRIDTIKSNKGTTQLQDLNYDFDAVGNLTKRQNRIASKTEDFKYDSLYRLESISELRGIASINRSKYGGALYGLAIPIAAVVLAPPVSDNFGTFKSFKYDGHGNIMNKNGKAYRYNGGRTHAASLIDGIDYEYDDNGNLTCNGLGCDDASKASRKIEWNSFNKPEKITKKTATDKETIVKLAYDSGHNRIIKESTHTDTAKIGKTTWTIAGGLVEREKTTSGSNSGAEVYKFTIKAGGKTVAYINQNLSKTGTFTANKIRYLLTDHLGSTDVVTDKYGKVVLDLSFDAWGKRRNASWSDSTPTELDNIIASFSEEAYKIGFTGHEHDDDVGLINMKGRLYDAEIGRFISADPHVQAATDTQSFNRYTYVKNNPLSFTDPSGYFFKSLFKSIKKFFKKFGRTILAIAATIVTGGLAAGFLGGSAFGTFAGLSGLGFGKAVIAGAVGGFFGGAVSTGSLKGALRGAVFGGLSAGLANGIGHGFDGLGGIGNPGSITRAIAHGVAQGTVSVLRGGKFGAGFISSFASSVGSRFIKGGGVLVKAAKHAVLGGTVSALVGGKFANGAVSAAFVYLFNDAAQKQLGIKKFTGRYKKDGYNFKTSLRKGYEQVYSQDHKNGPWKGSFFGLTIDKDIGRFLRMPVGVTMQFRDVDHVNVIQVSYHETYQTGYDTGRIFVEYYPLAVGMHEEWGIFPVIFDTLPVEPRFSGVVNGSVEKW